MAIADNSALIIIDVQKGLAEPSLGLRKHLNAETNMAALLATWREQKHPNIHILHCSQDRYPLEQF
jgi:nicotinamidase-related amidase